MRCGIALGSNIGDRLAHLKEARAAVESLHLGAASGVLYSSVYETEPVDCEPGSAPYLNAVMEIEYEGQPFVLLHALRGIETDLGRPSRRPRNAPRTIDLDILYVGNLAMSNDELVLPHPRLHSRRFVLEPLNEIRPDLLLPGHHEPIAELLTRLPASPEVQRIVNNTDWR
jgi:2-amino-4-hydroxy-6-hydroxymethyldihydropteridine diphosphokinase